jgi:hypothetical protein
MLQNYTHCAICNTERYIRRKEDKYSSGGSITKRPLLNYVGHNKLTAYVKKISFLVTKRLENKGHKGNSCF